jgi:hypothetical protein
MTQREISHIIAAIIILTAIISLAPILQKEYTQIPQLFVFAIIIVAVPIIAKKLTANALDANVEHELWFFQRFGFWPRAKFKGPIPAGIIFPLFISIFTLGYTKLMTLLTYETKALKRRAAKRFGFYSFTEITEFHHGLIGAAGILSLLVLALIAYLIPSPNLELLTKLSVYYAFWNIIPFSKLDGTQIFFANQILYFTLATITLIATVFVFLLL